MVETPSDWFYGVLDIAIIDEPAHFVVDGALDGDADTVGMPVETATFVIFWDPRQVVSGLEAKFFDEFDDHGVVVVLERA